MNSVDIVRKSLILLCSIFTLVGTAYADSLFGGEASPFAFSDGKSDSYFDKSINKAQTIKDIEIYGTNVVRPSLVISTMQMKKGDPFDAEMIQRDLKSIYQLGFFTEKMKAIPIENPDGTITIKILLEENIPVKDVVIDGNTVISTEELMPLVVDLIGKPQNIDSVNQAIERINTYYSQKGYILARVDVIYDDPDGTINIGLKEGIINKILISGNNKTKEYVITRNILTEPGMVYNENQVKEDLVRLYSTQAFKDVNRSIDACPDDPDKYDITIVITEQRTASISLGGGLDSSTGVFGSLGISDNNFRGLNQRVSLSGLVGSGVIMSDTTVKNHMNFQAELSFFQPYFLNADTSLMSKIFFRDFGSYNIPLAVEDRIGVEATLSHRMKENPNLLGTFSVGVENVHLREGDKKRITNMFKAKKMDIKERANQLEGGLFLTFSPGFRYDTRDSQLNPRNGVLASLRFDQAFGMDEFKKTHGKLTGMIKRFFPVASKSSLSLTAKAGGKLYGDNMPEVMAYRLGGPYTIRGYKINGVGSGDAFAMGSIELATPVLFLDRLKVNFFQNLRMTFFVDAGKVFHGYKSDKLYDRPMEAITAGVGLKLYIPGVGPLSVDYGIPLTRSGAYGSKHGYFTFGVGDMMY